MAMNLVVIFVMMVACGVITLATLANPRAYAFFVTIGTTGWTYLAARLSGGFIWSAETLPFFPGGALWTIGVELGFYLVAPLIIGRKWTPLALPLAFAASLSLAFAQMHIQSGWIDTTVPCYLWIFLLVARFSQIEGYKCLSLTRALDVVKCQLALV